MHIYPIIWIFVYCFFIGSNSFDLSRHLGEKTPYWIQQSPEDYTPPPRGCSLIHINLVARHGIREPTGGDIKKLTLLETFVRNNWSSLKNISNFEWLKDWINPYKLAQQGYLVPQGENEHYRLGKRLKEYFPSGFSKLYFSLVYPIQTTQVPRASRSGNAFGYGLWEGNGTLGDCNFRPFYSYSESDDQDLTLRFFDNCPNFESSLSSTAVSESTLFENKFIPEIASRLSILFADWNVTIDQVKWMYKACAFEFILTNVTDRWCSIFTEQDFLNFEYLSDLSTYYERGYGNPIAYKISFLLLREFIDIMSLKANGSLPDQQAKLRFAHAETIIPFITLLGLLRDPVPIYANSSSQTISNRLWRTSVISTFTANTKMLLYNCSQGSSPLFLVKLMHNEKEYTFPKCQNKMFCDLQELIAIYSDEIGYDFNGLCQARDSQSTDWKTVAWVAGIGGGGFILGLLVFGIPWFLGRKKKSISYYE